jgi:hypothetical protein
VYELRLTCPSVRGLPFFRFADNATTHAPLSPLQKFAPENIFCLAFPGTWRALRPIYGSVVRLFKMFFTKPVCLRSDETQIAFDECSRALRRQRGADVMRKAQAEPAKGRQCREPRTLAGPRLGVEAGPAGGKPSDPTVVGNKRVTVSGSMGVSEERMSHDQSRVRPRVRRIGPVFPTEVSGADDFGR